ncbi:MAG: hypothetical protein GWN18_03610, partial [Thermoplasmata archaeon]|nr:hypothetical protein [Thermoplasmata archaeon]NIS19045.1 hypothetical protein [Thermoplasmata archaeon]NIV77827.1 hypothetical protein [Thermoplasmata archaeon]NIW81672.1 hypothetical protein [Thermoplasmata archaeon]NIW87862.1 hypothetical protein [Thermoplasmata archaeon]
MRIALLFGVVATLACSGGGSDGPASSDGDATAGAPPNVVFVLLDDVRLDDVVGNPLVDLP